MLQNKGNGGKEGKKSGVRDDKNGPIFYVVRKLSRVSDALSAVLRNCEKLINQKRRKQVKVALLFLGKRKKILNFTRVLNFLL